MKDKTKQIIDLVEQESDKEIKESLLDMETASMKNQWNILEAREEEIEELELLFI